MVYKCFDKKSTGSGIVNNNNNNIIIKQNLQLAEELRKPIIRKSKKRKVYSGFRDNVWGADLADIQLISKFNEGFRFLLCVIDIFSKYAWVVPLKDKKVLVLLMLFKKYRKNLIKNLIKYGLIKEMNFTIILFKNK